MRFLSSPALANYGHVILPSLAGILGLSAISSQWSENHRLRAEIQNVSVDRTMADRLTATKISVSHQKSRAHAMELNQWIDAFNQYAVQLTSRSASTRKSAEDVIYQHNAQAIVAIYQAGCAAGVHWDGTNKGILIREVLAGKSPTDGPFKGTTFKVPNIPENQLPGTAKYIRWVSGQGLVFDLSNASLEDVTKPAEPESIPTPPTFPAMPKFPEI